MRSRLSRMQLFLHVHARERFIIKAPLYKVSSILCLSPISIFSLSLSSGSGTEVARSIGMAVLFLWEALAVGGGSFRRAAPGPTLIASGRARPRWTRTSSRRPNCLPRAAMETVTCRPHSARGDLSQRGGVVTVCGQRLI